MQSTGSGLRLRAQGPLILLALLLSGCVAAASAGQPDPATAQPATAVQIRPSLTPTSRQALPSDPPPERPSDPPTRAAAQATATPRPTLAPGAWKNLPVVPVISQTAREIYRRGLALGNNPRAFSKVGDCESTPGWFLSDFDNGPRYYDLGAHDELLPVIAQFSGSYKRVSLAVRAGFSASSVLTPLWADRKLCQAGESPLDCEYRIQKPSFVFITLGSNNASKVASFEPQMRKILDETIARGIVPILATKADNLEGDDSINETIARLAQAYDLPLWNFWAAVQPLPHQGLQSDRAHLTWAANRFDNPENMKSAWPWRNLTALQVLDAVWRGVQE